MALEEKLNQAKGALKENVGKLTGDKKIGIRRCRRKNNC